MKRERLASTIPLSTPFTVYIDPSSACNFKCEFCCHSINHSEKKSSGFSPLIMDFQLFCNIIEQLKDFPDRIKMLSLFLVGEPLLNKKLPKMIEHAKKSMVADKIFLTTNGSLLNEATNMNLINSGLDEILISVEALTSEGYRKIASVDIDYNLFIKNISHLYLNKKQCNVFIKIIDTNLTGEEVELFHYMYDDICDLAYIEPIMPVFKGVDYSEAKIPKTNKTGRNIEVCTRPFFTMSVHPNGNVGCCIVDYSEGIVFGNIEQESLKEIWNNSKINKFRRSHLKKHKNKVPICNTCSSPYYDTQPSDILDDDAEKLLFLF